MKKLISMVCFTVGMVSTNAYALLNLEGDRVVVTASRLAQEGSRVAGNVTVITNEQIAESNAQSVPDLLQEVEGVYAFSCRTRKHQYPLLLELDKLVIGPVRRITRRKVELKF